MNIVILSGKGGTGKTTVSTNLAETAGTVCLVDCDVEEPNCHLFLKPEKVHEIPVSIGYPVIDDERCISCGECARFCYFNAILSAGTTTITMPGLCHDCGGCALVCKYDAISYEYRRIGTITAGSDGEKTIMFGTLDVGEMSGVRIIEQMKSGILKEGLTILDSPPGTSCSTVTAVTSADYAVLVAEPTPFGVSDMKMVVEMLEDLAIPFGVVVNKSGLGDEEVYEYCVSRAIPILGEIPFDKKVAEVYSSGKLIVNEIQGQKGRFELLLKEIEHRASETRHGSE